MKITVTLTLKITIKCLHDTPAYHDYHPIKFGCKKISSLVDMVETVISNYMSPHCDCDLEDGKSIFLHDTGP